MHKHNAHGATDVTGFGLLGHAKNLAKSQRGEVSFTIHNLPVIAKVNAMAKASGNMVRLQAGVLPETSGKNKYNLGMACCSLVRNSMQLSIFFVHRWSTHMLSPRTSCKLLQRN